MHCRESGSNEDFFLHRSVGSGHVDDWSIIFPAKKHRIQELIIMKNSELIIPERFAMTELGAAV